VIIISLAAALAVATAILFAVRLGSSGWGASVRLFRDDNEHPDWELLAQ
jgi:hypothetical protein